jgi:hypothetical protein
MISPFKYEICGQNNIRDPNLLQNVLISSGPFIHRVDSGTQLILVDGVYAITTKGMF